MPSIRTAALAAALALCCSACGGGREAPPPKEDPPASAPAPAPPSAEAKAPPAGEGAAKADSWPAPTPAQEAQLAEALAGMRKQLGDGFVVEGRFPFAVAGDLTPPRFQRFFRGTIGDAYEAFYRQFFKVRPDRVLRVYLFADDPSYREWPKRIWDDEPSSPYGYYKPSEWALVMNIGTGGGTLVHEMVHALMAFDFPDVPTWFSEGMGSLFEQCSIESGIILGHENWRLPILKKGIREKRTLPLRRLLATTRGQFLDDESSLHYAQARYFCMHLQEEGLLQEFYKAFRDGFAADPTGVATAQNVLGKKLEEVEPEMLKWIGTLKWE
jgi:hypothetical protein